MFSLTRTPPNILKVGRAPSTMAGKRAQHSLKEIDGPKQKTRKRCHCCYEKISLNEGFKIDRNRGRRVSTFCNQCNEKPHLCIPCFTEKHVDV